MEAQVQQTKETVGPKKTFDVVIKDNWQIIVFFLVISMAVGQYTFKLSSMENRILNLETQEKNREQKLADFGEDIAVIKNSLEFIKEKLNEQ